MFLRRYCCFASAVILASAVGCATSRTSDTARTGIEQLLISNAVDQALRKVQFDQLHGQSIFVQDKYLDGVDKNYVVGSVRHLVLASGCELVDKIEDADVILEVRSGGIGTDSKESFIGSPKVALPGPMPFELPEVRLITTKTQTGTAKIGIVAYDAKSHATLGRGGLSLARSTDSNWYILGAGPFNSGHIRKEVTEATSEQSVAMDLGEQLHMVRSNATEVPRYPVDVASSVSAEATSPASGYRAAPGPVATENSGSAAALPPWASGHPTQQAPYIGPAGYPAEP